MNDVPFQSQQIIVCVQGHGEQNVRGLGHEMVVQLRE
jgi:hypothetical protein